MITPEPASSPVWSRIDAELAASRGLFVTPDGLAAEWDEHAPESLHVGAFNQGFGGRFNRSFHLCERCADTLSLHGAASGDGVEWVALNWTPISEADALSTLIQHAYLALLASVLPGSTDIGGVASALGLPPNYAELGEPRDRFGEVEGRLLHMVVTDVTLYVFVTRP